MSGEIVNLRRARKQRERTQRDEAAADNRLRFGLSKADREAAGAERRVAEQRLDGHLRASQRSGEPTDRDG